MSAIGMVCGVVGGLMWVGGLYMMMNRGEEEQ